MTNPEKNSQVPACRRCGQCCRNGGPALHRDDLPLLRGGSIPRSRLLTLRAGEMVHENVAGGLIRLDSEIVRLAAGTGSPACPFHDDGDSACLIHENRPVECRALCCDDTSAVKSMYRESRLTRADILDTGGALWELVLFHEDAFPAGATVELARKATSGMVGKREAADSLAELVRAEANFRRAFQERAEVSPGEMDFLFGRSLARICAQFGMRFDG